MQAEINDIVIEPTYDHAKDVWCITTADGNGSVELYPHQFAGLYTLLPADTSEPITE